MSEPSTAPWGTCRPESASRFWWFWVETGLNRVPVSRRRLGAKSGPGHDGVGARPRA